MTIDPDCVCRACLSYLPEVLHRPSSLVVLPGSRLGSPAEHSFASSQYSVCSQDPLEARKPEERLAAIIRGRKLPPEGYISLVA